MSPASVKYSGDFSLRHVRKCEDCGTEFEPRSGRLRIAVTLLVGCVLTFVVPLERVLSISTDRGWGMLIFEGFLVLCCVAGGLEIIRRAIAGIRSRTPRIIG